MTEYTTPPILLDADETDILNRMVADLREHAREIDVSEGSVAYDLLHPTAVEVERLKQFDLDYLFQQIWPQFADGEALDYHAEARGLKRKDPTPAIGTLTVTGPAGTPITAGDLFATEGVGFIPSMSYSADQDYVIPDSGTIDISVTCTETGINGNCTAGKIIIVESSDDEITSCTNPSAMTGGAEEESDDDLRQRILDFDQSKEQSYTGSIADYMRWANEVPGVGGVNVIPANDTTGLVTIVLTDGNGEPATQALCESVYNYIMRPDNPYERLAPINANLSVVPPTTVTIFVVAVLELLDTSIEDVKNKFIADMKKYFTTAVTDGEIRYQKVANILGDIDGVYDFTDLKINGGTENIDISGGDIPTFTDYSVVFLVPSDVKIGYVVATQNTTPVDVVVPEFSYERSFGRIFADDQYSQYIIISASNVLSITPMQLDTAPDLIVDMHGPSLAVWSFGIRNEGGQSETWTARSPVAMVKYYGDAVIPDENS